MAFIAFGRVFITVLRMAIRAADIGVMEKKVNASDPGMIEVRRLPAGVTIPAKRVDIEIRPALRMTGIAINILVPAGERKGGPIMVERLRITQAERVFARPVFLVTDSTVLLDPLMNDGPGGCANPGMTFSA